MPHRPKRERSGSITGRIIAETGEPLPSVRVRAHLLRGRWPSPRDFGWNSIAGDSFARDIFSTISALKQEREETEETYTDSFGEFEIPGFGDAFCDVWPEHPGWIFAPLLGMSSTVKSGERVSFVATKIPEPVELPVACVLPDGREPESAQLTAQPVSRKGFCYLPNEPWRPDRRRLSLEPGGYTIAASAEIAGRKYASRPVILFLRPGEKAETLTLRLRSPGICGRLIVPEGAAIEEVPVAANPVWSGQFQEEPEFSEFSNQSQSAATKENGFRYSLAPLRAGLYQVAAFWGRQGPPAAEAIVQVGEEEVELDLPLRPPEFFFLKAYGPGGEDITDSLQSVDLQCYHWTEKYSTCFPRSALSSSTMRSEDGSRVLTLKEKWHALQSKPGCHWVLAVASEYGSVMVPVDLQVHKQISVRFQAPARLAALLEGYAEGRHDGNDLSLHLYARVETPWGTCRGDEVACQSKFSGRYAALEPLQPGRYDLTARLSVGEMGSRTFYSATVEIPAGGTEVRIPLPPLFDLTVFCPGLKGSEVITLYGLEGTREWDSLITPTSPAVFARLPPGTYRLRMGGSLQGVMDVTLPGPELVEFRPQPFNALRADHLPELSYSFRAGIGWSDTIVGLGTDLFERAEDLTRALEAAIDREEVYLLVQDYEGRRAVPVEPRKFLEDLRRGYFVPVRRR